MAWLVTVALATALVGVLAAVGFVAAFVPVALARQGKPALSSAGTRTALVEQLVVSQTAPIICVVAPAGYWTGSRLRTRPQARRFLARRGGPAAPGDRPARG